MDAATLANKNNDKLNTLGRLHKPLFSLPAFALLLAAIFAAGCIQEARPALNSPAGAYNSQYDIYLDYLEATGEGLSASPQVYDTAIIEGTIVSVEKSDFCPLSDGEKCRIEPYPNDNAVVKVDKISKYENYSEKNTSAVPKEGPQEPPMPSDFAPQNRGKVPDNPSGKSGRIPTYSALQEGDEVSAHFILSLRPAKVRYVPFGGETSTTVSKRLSSGSDSGSNSNEYKPIEPGRKTVKPLAKEGDYYVFTTKIGDYPNVVEKTLSGLKQGSRFRAEVRYDGTLKIEEYELIT